LAIETVRPLPTPPLAIARECPVVDPCETRLALGG
jgi:hypothetical protein